MTTIAKKATCALAAPVALRSLVFAGVLVMLWLAVGANYTAFGIAVEALPPVGLVGLRLVIAGPLMVAGLIVFAGARLQAISALQWRNTAIAGVLLLGIGQSGIVWSIQYLPSAVAALLMGAAPLWIALLGASVFRTPLSRSSTIGVVIGFAGLAVIIGAPGGNIPVVPALVALAAAIAWALGSLFAQRAAMPANAALGAAIQMTLVGGLLMLLSWIMGEEPVAALGAADHLVWSAMVYLVFGGSILAYGSFVWVIQASSAAVANTSSYVGPIVAGGIGWIFLGEHLSLPELIAGATALIGVALIVNGSRQGGDQPRDSRGGTKLTPIWPMKEGAVR